MKQLSSSHLQRAAKPRKHKICQQLQRGEEEHEAKSRSDIRSSVTTRVSSPSDLQGGHVWKSISCCKSAPCSSRRNEGNGLFWERMMFFPVNCWLLMQSEVSRLQSGMLKTWRSETVWMLLFPLLPPVGPSRQVWFWILEMKMRPKWRAAYARESWAETNIDGRVAEMVIVALLPRYVWT